MSSALNYRQSGAVIAVRDDGHVLLVRKPRRHHAWQFPQGGVESGEDFRTAAVREFHEEVGTDKVEIIGDERGCYRYDFPPNAEFPAYVVDRTAYRGQEVHLFLARFIGTDADIHLNLTELAEWRWVTVAELPTLVESPEYLALVTDILNDSILK